MALEILIGYFVIVSVNELSFDFSNIKAGKLIFFPQFSINI